MNQTTIVWEFEESMLKSMTAYSQATIVLPIGKFVVEIHSVNRKHLEMGVFLPKELIRYDTDIRKWVSAAVGRGQVTIKILVTFDQASPVAISPNLALARQVESAWNEIANDLGLTLATPDLLRILSQEEGMLIYGESNFDEELFRRTLKEITTQALTQLVAMKHAEGKVLYEDIVERFSKMGKILELIAVKAPDATLRFRQRLKERLDEALGASIDNEERILREVCVYAERVDIAEEITRFRSHLSQVNALINQEDDVGVGKKLEFLIQELNREINTIGSKSADVDVSHWVIEIKSELERVREQIQNIE